MPGQGGARGSFAERKRERELAAMMQAARTRAASGKVATVPKPRAMVAPMKKTLKKQALAVAKGTVPKPRQKPLQVSTRVGTSKIISAGAAARSQGKKMPSMKGPSYVGGQELPYLRNTRKSETAEQQRKRILRGS